VRQIVRLAGVGQGAVQRELRRLSAAGVIERSESGAQVYYRASEDCPVFAELHGLMTKTAGVADVIRRALEPLADQIKVAFVYGSLATGQETPDSDVDLMVVGEVSFALVVRALRDAQDRLAREVNPTVFPPKELRSKLRRKHHFLTQVMRGPKVFLMGDDDELGRVVS